ncbi:CshA/CshB family fibrillar adhesin-related protein [Streptococcus mitis]|uniref:CshA protein n=1 Tax=Streptococcus mitis TaxID=28037 RepID=A0A139QCD9_STRMT|nr:CshA/CshB family fibrillar adhesin-related protein [Streptococcus mitis]KXU00199.1 CshA protein [Streptococcus mitis]
MFKLSRQQKDHRYFCGNKYEKYSIKKLKVGAASVLVGTGFLFGYNLDQVNADEQKTETATVMSKVGDTPQSANKVEVATDPKQEKAPEVGTETLKPGTKEEVVPATSPQVAETKETPETKEVSKNKVNSVDKETVNSSTLRANLADLEAQIERIRGNKKQASQIQNAEKLVADARQYLEALSTTQKEVDAKAKQISSLTSILKSIKAEETVKENKNTDSRNGKKMQEGTGFREGGVAGTGVGADVVDATAKPYNPNAVRSDFSNKEASAGMLNQVSWLDFSNLADWQNVKMLPDGNMALQEGSVYTKEIMKDYIVKITVKSLKPFQATEIYRKRLEAAGATEEEKATYDPTARNWYMKNRGSGAGDANQEVNIIAKPMDRWTEIKKAGLDTGTRKTTIKAEKVATSIGVQFDISGTYRGKPVRPAVVMTDGESANPGESVIFTTNGTGWQLISEVKQDRQDARHYTPVDIGSIQRNTFNERYGNGIDYNNYEEIENHGMRQGKGYGPDNKKIAYKYLSSPDLETGGLGSGVFGPVTNAGSNSTPVVMTKDATEVGFYIVTDGHQAAMIGFVPVDSGDAPATYGEATHTLTTISSVDGSEVKQPYLGSVRPDMDTGNEKNWLGDDTKEEADEGIDQILPDNLKGQTNQVIKMNRERQGSYTLQVQAHTGGAPEAHIYGWIDFNHNGTFEENERSDLATITKDGPVTLQFNNNIAVDDPSLVELGTRVRIATTSKAIEQPTGIAGTGEVEDFKTQITHPPVGEKKTTEGLVKETQRESIHFTARGKTSYDMNTDTSIDTNTPPVYIDNKTGQAITLSADGTYTVAGQGTYKFIVADNKIDVNVEFTPADGFVGEAHGITLRRQDTNGATTDWISKDTAATPVVNDVRQSMDGLYIPKVTVPTSVNATPVNADSQNLQGLPQKGKPTFNVESAKEPVTASAKYPAKLVDPRTNTVTELTTVDAFEQGTTNKIGTYTIVPETGEITFTPNKDFKGIPAPATISADVELTHDKDGNVTTKTLTATYTPTITPVTPTAEKSETSDVQGKVQTSPIKLDTEETGDDKGKTVNFDKGTQTGPKGERVELNPETLTLLDSTGEEVTSVTTPQGKYELDKANKTISFTPNKDFVGTATPVKVQIKDVNGTKVETTYTPTVTDVTMESVDKTSEAPQGQTQTGKPEFTISSPNVQITGYKLVDPVSKTPVDSTEIEVPEQGTYKIDKTTGQVTFIPKPGYTGTADGITVQATDENGETKDAKYTPKVTPLTVTPENKTSKNIQGVPQEGTPTFTIPEGVTNASITSRKLVDPTYNTPKDSVIVEGKGTFVIDETGKVTFTPVPSYTGEVPAIEVEATVTVTNEKNEPATITSKATYKPEIVPVKPTAESSTTSDVQGKVQTSSIVLDTEETGDDKGKTVNFNKGIEQGPKGERTELNPDTLTLLNEAGEEVTSVTTPQGKYELDKANKTITFTPNKDFAGEATPVKVQIKDANGTKVETTYTPTVIEVTPTGKDSATTGPQGIAQTSPIVFNQKDEADNTTVNFETGHERVELKQDTLTLVNGNGEKVTTITVPEVGTYELKDGAITFTPVKTFTGTAEGVTVQVEDENGKVVTKKYVPIVTPVTPEGTPVETTGIQGATQEGTPTFKPGNPNVPINEEVAPTLEGANPEGKVVVPGEGTYTVDKDGKVTFTPEPQFTGTAKGVTVKRVDKNGTPVTAKYTPTVTPVTPEGTPAETTGIQGTTQEGTPTFKPGNPNVPMDEEVAPTLEGANPEGKVVVLGEGTYTVDKDGKVTFTPEPQFTGTAKGVTVKRVDKNGTPVTAKYTPTVTPVTPTGENAETEGPKAKPQTSTIVFDKKDQDNTTVNFDKGHENVALDPTTTTLVGKDGKPTTEVKIPGEGTYTLANNVITFTPEPDFVGKATGVTVQVKDANGTKVEKTYTPTVRPVTTFVDEAGNPITVDKNNTPVVPEEDGTQPKKDIPGYRFVETKKLPNGDTEHVYEKVKTSFKDKEGNEISGNPSEDGEQPKKAIPGYRFVETKKLPNGDTEHVYEKVTTPTPSVEKPRIIARDTEGNIIPGFEFDMLSPILDIPEYEYVGEEPLSDGTIKRIYKKVKKSTTPAKPYSPTPTQITEKVLTTFVDENGNVIIQEENGSHPGREIEGYELIGIKRDSIGNVRNIYRKIHSTIPVESVQPTTPTMPEQSAQPVQTVAVKEAEAKRELPNTGTEDHANLAALGLLGVLSGFGLVARKKKED